jgi:uncharacterized protein (TIGR02246 family)
MLILVATLTLAACNSTPAEQPKAADSQADKDAINKLRDDFIAAFNSNDAAKVGDVYAETAVVMDAGQPTVEGRAAIVEHNKMFFDANMAKITLASRAMNVSGDLAFDEGTYSIDVTPKAGGQAMKAEGRYLVVIQRTASGWKILEDMGNTVAPPPPPPAPETKGKK